MRTALALCLALATPAAAQQDMTDAEREDFRAEVRAYLLDNPEVIMEAVGVLEQREQSAQAEADIAMAQENAELLYNDPTSWVGGNPEGDITIVEFLDYRCGYCKQAHPEVTQLIESDGNIRYIVKEFPILGDQSVLASRFAVAVKMEAGDDAYETVNDALMTMRTDVTPEALLRLANTLGLDSDAILAQMDSDDVTDVIARNRALGQQLDITGTPTFVVEDQMLRGYVPGAQMAEIVSQIRG
ncbi:MAG: DsbA family protein [Paracoccaceae bacterium]